MWDAIDVVNNSKGPRIFDEIVQRSVTQVSIRNIFADDTAIFAIESFQSNPVLCADENGVKELKNVGSLGVVGLPAGHPGVLLGQGTLLEFISTQQSVVIDQI